MDLMNNTFSINIAYKTIVWLVNYMLPKAFQWEINIC